ncbi:MAG: hypothetical protein AAF565_13865 [Pseudomonadota bacterium]
MPLRIFDGPPGARLLALRELMGLSGDPNALEASDFDASEDFSIGESEDGNAVINSPRGSRETRIPFSEDTDTFVGLAEEAEERREIREAAIEAADTDGSGDLSPEERDASEDYTITESETGFVVVSGPNNSFETQIAFGEDTDSFVELEVFIRSALSDLMALSGDPLALEPSDLDASPNWWISEAEDGTVQINFIANSYETRIPFGEATDTFVELAEFDPPRPLGPEPDESILDTAIESIFAI